MCTIDYDDEPCVIWEETPRLSQKERECASCWATMPRRTPYLSHKSLFDGRWTNEAMCFECWWVREAFAQEHGASFVPSALMETLRECHVATERYHLTTRSVHGAAGSVAVFYRPEPDRWAPELASVLARRRTSTRHRRNVRRERMRMAVAQEIQRTRHILAHRKQLPTAARDN